MSPEYNRINAPIMRSPLLFHQPPVRSAASAYYTSQPSSGPTKPQFYPNTGTYPLQPQLQHHTPYAVQASLPSYPQPYPYYSPYQLPKVSSPMPISAYPVPIITYTATASSKGLSLILIAILVLVALDLMLVRPQKISISGAHS